MTRSNLNIIYAFLGGAAVGAGVAFLTAPRSGLETRNRLKESFTDAYGRAGQIPHAIGEAANRGKTALRERYRSAVGETPLS